MSVIQKDISTFIEKQFPAVYREEGPVFVAFVKEYYKWLETKTPVSTGVVPGSYIIVNAQNNTVRGVNTSFSTTFSVGDQIAIYRDNEYYDIFDISSISNNTILSVNASPQFSNTKTTWGNVADKPNALYDSRRILEYTDVDTTIDDYIVHFKEKYLTGIQFDTNTNIRQLLKHTLDLYRAKGTSQALQLLFRIVFGTDIDIYYPDEDIFKLSDGEWFVPRYLEISLSETSAKLVNKQIIGVTSGATAFVDRAIRRKVNSHLIDVLYISSLSGKFQAGELLDLSGEEKLDPTTRPTMTGSLGYVELDLNGVGTDFEVGDIVSVYSNTGGEAFARVTDITNNAGVIKYNLIDGGYGYEVGGNTSIFISSHIIRLSNIVVDKTSNPWINTYTQMFETLTQPMATINYVSANGAFQLNDEVYTYYANSSNKGHARVINITESNSTTGTMRVSILSGNLQSNQIFTTSNAVVANQATIAGYTDATITANVIGQSNSLILELNNITNSLEVGDVIYQYDSTNSVSVSGTIDTIINYGSISTLTIKNSNGVFQSNQTIRDAAGVAYANVINISIDVGVINSGGFSILSNNYAYFGMSNTTGIIQLISEGAGAAINVYSQFAYTETVSINTDKIYGYLSTDIGANAYGFPANTTANLSSTIASSLSTNSITVGKATQLAGIAPGSLYTAAPIIRVHDTQVMALNLPDYIINITGMDVPFKTGEIITQEATGARGEVKESNTSVLSLMRMNLNTANDFIITSNSTTILLGTNTNYSANATAVYWDFEPTNAGNNLIIGDALSVSNGSISGLEVLESGYGFVDTESVTISLNQQTLFGFANVNNVGTGRGYYRKKGGFLSDQKKLHDGYYYQNYSYDILSSITLDKYAEMLRTIAHVAGTKNFASFVNVTNLNSQLNIEKSIVTLS